MSGITFLHGGLRFWLLALSIPLLLHLLTRRARRAVTLPTFRFLERALAHQSRLFRWRRLLLLALRLLALLFLVSAFLKPTLTAPLAAGGQRRVVLVVLDVSLSMGYTQGGVSSLARVKGQAGALLDDLRQGDLANVVLAGGTLRSVLPKPGSDFSALRQAVQNAVVTPERGDPAAAVALASQQLASMSAPRRELILAADFQRTNWGDVQFDSLPPGVRLVFLASDAADRANAAVTGLKLRPAAPQAGEEAAVDADLWNGAPISHALAVTLSVQRDGEAGEAELTSQTNNVTLPPYTGGTVTFPVTFPDAGRYRIVARVPADDLPADDARYLAADLRHSLTVLLLTDSPLSGATGSYFLLRALNPDPDAPGGIRVLPRRGDQLSEADLKTCDAVVLNAVTTLPADRVALLAHYVADGGALLAFFSGPQIVGQMEALAKQAPAGEALPFLPRVPMDVRTQGKGYITLTEARYESQLLQIFKDPDAADLGKIRFTRFFLTGEPDPRAEILLKYEDGTPAAARGTVGAGSVLLCNFSPALDASDLARQEVFPPLVHEFVKGLTAKAGERREFTPGGAASATLDALPQGKIVVVGPDGEPETATADRASGAVLVEHVGGPGFHTVTADGRNIGVFAVNANPDESDLRALDPRELEDRQRAHPAVLVEGSGSSAQMEALRRGRPLWPYCLLAALIALLLEQAVATCGGQARASGSGLSPNRPPATH